MFFIPGFIISIATFPGVIVHELGHLLFCRLRGVPVFAVKFFSPDIKTSGYVIHAKPESFSSTFLICVGPLLLNTLLCLLICLPVAIPYRLFGDRSLVTYFYLWLGISIGMHAFPSTKDASNLWEEARSAANKGKFLTIVSMPVVGLIYLANLLSFFWFDAIYGFAVGVLLPQFLVKLL
jgi:hypothetical protein